MRSSDFKLVHVSPRVQAHGGIEALHAVHRTLPRNQVFVALFDREPEARPDYVNLNFNWRTTLGQMRREFAEAMRPHAASIVIYHNGWGLPLFCGQDAAVRRLIYCHANPSYLRREIQATADLVDGAIGVTPALTAAWTAMQPPLDNTRQCILPLPIVQPPGISRNPNHRAEVVLGYAGRLEREQKRLDRLPEFLRALDATGLNYRFEVLGDGPLRSTLERKLSHRVRFHGWRQGEAYWRAIADWDGNVLFSDYEGSPIAMLEAMKLGVLPFFPQIGGTIGDVYVPQIDDRCYYPAGDMGALAANVKAVFSERAACLEALRAKTQALVAHHTIARYSEMLLAFVNGLASQPRVSAAGPANPRRWFDALPLGVVARIAPQLLLRR